MSVISQVLLISILYLALYRAEDLQLGCSEDGQLDYQKTIKLSSFFFMTRIEFLMYYSFNATIKAISAIDIDKTNTIPVVTAGGVNSSYVTIRFKSAKGVGIHYRVQIFVWADSDLDSDEQ